MGEMQLEEEVGPKTAENLKQVMFNHQEFEMDQKTNRSKIKSIFREEDKNKNSPIVIPFKNDQKNQISTDRGYFGFIKNRERSKSNSSEEDGEESEDSYDYGLEEDED